LNIIQGVALTLSKVYIYDTINDNWSTEITVGQIPSNRAGFSAILGLDGQRIIIFGGDFNNPDGYSLYVLNLTNFNWYIPNITGNTPNPRTLHKANVIGKYMVISFGFGYDKSYESDILLLDISNNDEYVWTTNFGPSPNKSVIIGATMGSIIGSILLVIVTYILYKRGILRDLKNDVIKHILIFFSTIII